MRSWFFTLLLAVATFWFGSSYQARSLLDNGEVAPAFMAITSEGELFRSAELEGQQTLLYFFAPWCGICRLSMPNLKFLQADNAGLAVYAIALQYDSAEQVEDFIADLDLQVPVLLGNQQLAQDFQIKAFPTYYVIDPQGQVKARTLGYSTALGLWLRSR